MDTQLMHVHTWKYCIWTYRGMHTHIHMHALYWRRPSRSKRLHSICLSLQRSSSVQCIVLTKTFAVETSTFLSVFHCYVIAQNLPSPFAFISASVNTHGVLTEAVPQFLQGTLPIWWLCSSSDSAGICSPIYLLSALYCTYGKAQTVTHSRNVESLWATRSFHIHWNRFLAQW